jgi:hypothetical protein
MVVNGRGYRILELTNVARVHGRLHPGMLAAVLIALTQAIVTAVFSMIAGSALDVTFGVALLTVPCGVAAFCGYRWPPTYALVADYRGLTVTLMCVRDKAYFDQVCRALVRAMERTVGTRH